MACISHETFSQKHVTFFKVLYYCCCTTYSYVTKDSTASLKMMKMLLKKFGVEADTAETGRAAVDMISLSSDPYQLVLMDNMMPEMVLNLYQCPDSFLFL